MGTYSDLLLEAQLLARLSVDAAGDVGGCGTIIAISLINLR